MSTATRPAAVIAGCEAQDGVLRQHLEACEPMVEYISDVASHCESMNDTIKLAGLRSALKLLVEEQQRVQALRSILTRFGRSMEIEYAQLPINLVKDLKQQEASAMLLPVECDPLWKMYDDLTSRADTNGQAMDDDLAMDVGNALAPNDKCPLTLKPMLDLKDPVADSRGIVYEKADVYAFLGRDIEKECPLAGTAHYIRARDLVPATKLLQAKKRMARAHLRAYDPSQASAGSDEPVLDI